MIHVVIISTCINNACILNALKELTCTNDLDMQKMGVSRFMHEPVLFLAKRLGDQH